MGSSPLRLRSGSIVLGLWLGRLVLATSPAPSQEAPGASAESAPDGAAAALPGFSLGSLRSGEGGGGGGGAEAEGIPVDDLRTPLLRKLVQKGILTPPEAAELDQEKKASFLNSLADKITVSGTSYFGYTYKFNREGSDSGDFELRRNYLTFVANLTSLFSFRTTFDITKEAGGGNIEVRTKYAYLYIKDFLPATSAEVGVAHTPWIDWEEHHGWLYRSVERTFIEGADSAGLFTSADLGVNVKTSTPFFSSEIGIYNGEGYDHLDRTGGGSFNNSAEARLTLHALGTGDKKVKPTKDQYLDISFNTFNSFHHNLGSSSGTVPGSSADARGSLDRLVYQVHAVFNSPLFLIAVQYAYNQDRFETERQDNHGVSVNAEVRPFEDISLFGRADYWKIDHGDDRKLYIYGVAYSVNSFVTFIVNGITSDKDDPAGDSSRAMVTVEMEW